MSIKKKARRIDLDTEEHIYHLKVKLFSASGISRGCDLPAPAADRRLFPQLSSIAPCSRLNPRTGLMLGSPNCAITGCTVRMKLWDHREMPASTYFLQLRQQSPPQLLMSLSWMERYDFACAERSQPGNYLDSYPCTSLCLLWKHQKETFAFVILHPENKWYCH